MNFLDMRTVIFSHLVTDALCALVVAFLWQQNRKRFAGTAWWVLDFAFQATAMLLIVLRGSIPDWMSMVLANTLIIAGALAGYMGLERFVGKTSSQVHNYLLLAAFAGVHTYFTLVQPSLAARNLNVSLGLLIVYFQSAWLMLRRVRPDLRRKTLEVGLVCGALGLISLARIVITLASPPPGNDFFQSGAFDTLILMSYQMLLILLAYSLILMVSGRLLAEIQIQEEKFAKAFRSSPYAILFTRLADGRILEVNDGFVDMSGYSRAEAIGQTTPDLRLWAREEERAAVVNELSKSQKVREAEFQFRSKSGAIVIGLYSAEIITLDNQPWVLSSINDITERKRAEEALRELNATLEQRVADRTRRLAEANAQLSELDRLKDDFISRISHELRTPLTSIKIYLEMLDTVKPEKRARYMQVLTEQTNRLQQLIESLLEVTQQSVNAAGVHVAPTDLNHLAVALAADVASRAATRGLTLTTALTPELPFAAADAISLAQALSKLAANALDYTPAGGTIELSTAEVIDAGETWITCTIRDNGPGVAPDEQAHIFERFYRGRAAADYKIPGTGIGLSISRDLIALLDGRLTVQSDGVPGHGAAFTAWLKPA